MFKLDLKRQRNQRSNCQHPMDHSKSKRVPEKHLLCFIDDTKVFDCVDHNKLWKILKEMGIPDHLTCLLQSCMQVKKQHLGLDMKQRTDSKSGKVYVEAVYCHLVYLTYMHYTSCKMPGWMKHKQAEIKFAGKNINNLRYADDTTLMAESEEELKSV